MATHVDFKLYLITDRKICVFDTFLKKIELALEAGVKAIQLRKKNLPARELLTWGKELRKLTQKNHAKLFINDRLDVALSCNADGIHCPEEGLIPQDARRFLNGKLVGKSVHSLEKALEAENSGADFISFSPIFQTPSKNGILEPKGLKELDRVASALKIPVFALGGITPENASSCLEAGAFGVAVIRAILEANDIRKTVLKFKKALGTL